MKHLPVILFVFANYTTAVADEQVINLDMPQGKIIFITESKWSGYFGGFKGADYKCNHDTAKPAGNSHYKAMLMGNNATHVGVQYTTPPGPDYRVIISRATTTDLTSGGSLDSPISSSNFPRFDTVWTGYNNVNCNNWSTSDSQHEGGVGMAYGQYDNPYWASAFQKCNARNHLYCVEQ